MTDSFYIVTADGRSMPSSKEKCIIALGSFDGVHVAHKAIFSEAIALKDRAGASLTGAWCFSDLPAKAFGKNIPMLCSLEEKISRILATGIDFVAVGDFSLLSGVAAEDFVDRLLIGELHCVGAVCGFNHRFGCNGTGSPEMLEDSFEEGHTSVPGIFASGDVVKGARTVVEAVAYSKIVAEAMDRYMQSLPKEEN